MRKESAVSQLTLSPAVTSLPYRMGSAGLPDREQGAYPLFASLAPCHARPFGSRAKGALPDQRDGSTGQSHGSCTGLLDLYAHCRFQGVYPP